MKSHASALVTILVLVSSCDGDGCNGGPTGPASRYCQNAMTTIPSTSAASSAAICKQCCIQEVPYKGTMDDGLCVCRR